MNKNETIRVRIKEGSYDYWIHNQIGQEFDVKVNPAYYHVVGGNFNGAGLSPFDCEIISPIVNGQIRIRVTKCRSNAYWYKNMIGQEFEVRHHTALEDMFVRLDNEELHIDKSDCEIISNQTNLFMDFFKKRFYEKFPNDEDFFRRVFAQAAIESVANDIEDYARLYHQQKGVSEETIKEIAWIAWKGAANSFRLYPENTHTFTEYWNGAKSQFDKYLTVQSNLPDVKLIERISSMKDDSGREGCTYGDTNYDSLSVVYGYNLAIDHILEMLTKENGTAKLCNQFLSEKQKLEHDQEMKMFAEWTQKLNWNLSTKSIRLDGDVWVRVDESKTTSDLLNIFRNENKK